MSDPRKIRDPIHNFIHLNDKESEIIDTLIFQRLRGIKQLAFAYLVYPGAVHSRFEHSLGVCCISNLITESLNFEEEDKRVVRFAALLHDIGHGPFSHVSEEALELYCDRENIGGRIKGDIETIHELITEDIILYNSDIRDCIGKSECVKVAELLSKGYKDPALKSIISGPMDADKQDYLLRDSHYCGVKYGVFDLHQLLNELKTIDDPSENKKLLMISEKGVFALEQFVLAKYYITTQVYRHKIRLITDQMMVRAINLGIEKDNIEELFTLYNFNGTEQFINNYIQWDDARFLLYFTDKRFLRKKCTELIKGLIERRLFKRIFKVNIQEFFDDCIDPLSRIIEPINKNDRRKLEKNITNTITETIKQEIDSDFVILYLYRVKSLYDRNEEEILVDTKPEPEQFAKRSYIFGSINEKLNDCYVEIYAPIKYRTHQERDDLIKKLFKPIKQTINDYYISRGNDHGLYNGYS